MYNPKLVNLYFCNFIIQKSSFKCFCGCYIIKCDIAYVIFNVRVVSFCPEKLQIFFIQIFVINLALEPPKFQISCRKLFVFVSSKNDVSFTHVINSQHKRNKQNRTFFNCLKHYSIVSVECFTNVIISNASNTILHRQVHHIDHRKL